MANIKKEVVQSVRAKLEQEQAKLRYANTRRAREMKMLVLEQTKAKREIAELGALIKTLPKYKEA